MAKIKKPAKNYNPLKHKPRGVNTKNFEKVYWPFLPLLLVAVMALGLFFQPGALKQLVPGRVLGYSTDLSRQVLLDDTNKLRADDNEADLTLNSKLNAAAQAKAEDMAKRGYWSHNTPDGKSPWTFIAAQHYSFQKLGENLATGFADSNSVIRAWYASQSHRVNLLNSAYTDVGFGFANSPDYKAAGGGPMTIVVAMYGQPPRVGGAVPSTASGPSIANTADSSRTSRAQLFLAKTPLAPVATSVVIVALLAAVGFFAGRHILRFRRAWIKSERFVIKHPAFDLMLILVAVLSFLLSQTAGLIQ